MVGLVRVCLNVVYYEETEMTTDADVSNEQLTSEINRVEKLILQGDYDVVDLDGRTSKSVDFPEIRKFCEWFKKEQEEKGMTEMYLAQKNLMKADIFVNLAVVLELEKLPDLIPLPSAIQFWENILGDVNNAEDQIRKGNVLPLPRPDVS